MKSRNEWVLIIPRVKDFYGILEEDTSTLYNKHGYYKFQKCSQTITSCQLDR
jgi:hypothetical protein